MKKDIYIRETQLQLEKSIFENSWNTIKKQQRDYIDNALKMVNSRILRHFYVYIHVYVHQCTNIHMYI